VTSCGNQIGSVTSCGKHFAETVIDQMGQEKSRRGDAAMHLAFEIAQEISH
jgi:hypothetical protein